MIEQFFQQPFFLELFEWGKGALFSLSAILAGVWVVVMVVGFSEKAPPKADESGENQSATSQQNIRENFTRK